MKVPKTRAVIADSLIRMFIEGPLVSLRGSPTVSPTTAFLCSSDFFSNTSGSPFSFFSVFETWVPASMNFFALSQAPPALENEIAI